MPEQIMTPQVISPDLKFIKDIIASGGEDLKKCYQCSTCTVVCNVTPDNTPFPRKEMMYAQWGMKDKLVSNPDIWLCHQCSDCTAYCPRGAKPGEVIGAIRNMAIKNYSVPSVLATMVGDSKYLTILFALPIIIFLAIIMSLGNLSLSSIPRGEDGGIVYSKFIPILYVDVVFIAAATFAFISFVLGIKKYWSAMSAGMSMKGNLMKSIKATIM
jgi:quinone-modifying oxidoreductase subunit QmoC